MPRAEVIVCADEPGEREGFAAWLREWRPQIESVSENMGCGCCVDIYEVWGSSEAILAIPEAMLGSRDTRAVDG